MSKTASSAAGSFREVRARIPIHLHPSRLSNIAEGVEEHLNQLLMNYVEDLGGFILMYRDVEVIEDNGAIFYSRPHINFHAEAKFIVFAPEVGKHLVGVVNKIAHDHIGLLVHGVFNASLIQKSGIPLKEYKYQSADDASEAAEMWAHTSNSKKNIVLGSQVRFSVARIQCTDEYFSMLGSLSGPECGVVGQAASIPPPSTPSANKQAKASKKKEVAEAAEEEEAEVKQDASKTKKEKKQTEKKGTKRKADEEEEAAEPVKKEKKEKSSKSTSKGSEKEKEKAKSEKSKKSKKGSS